MDRAALRQELKDLGHNYSTTGWDTRLDRFLNQGAKDVILDELWPQRRATATAVVGAAIPRLGPVKQVLRTTTQLPLSPATIDELRDGSPGPVPTGEPLYYYVVGNSAIAVWPTTAGITVDVDHYERTCWTDSGLTTRKTEASADTDVLLGGEIFEEAVILAARVKVLEDTDETDLWRQLQALLRGPDGFGGLMLQLRDRQLLLNVDEPQRIKQTREWV